MTKKEKFLKIVSTQQTDTIAKNKQLIENRDRLKESQLIAIKVLDKLEYLGWTQRKLAEKMGVSPQQVNKVVKGKENLTLETQIKLQNILDIPILASYYDNPSNQKPVAQALNSKVLVNTFGSFYALRNNFDSFNYSDLEIGTEIKKTTKSKVDDSSFLQEFIKI